jgi:formate dehydrogenase subunit gamma
MMDHRSFERLTLVQRLQHLAMVVSFTLLALTGLPMRFAETRWVGSIYAAVGGLGVARQIHRGAALLMMADGVVHVLYLLVLLVRSRFDLREAWPMLPSWKDARDWRDTSLYYVGLRRLLGPARDDVVGPGALVSGFLRQHAAGPRDSDRVHRAQR